MKVLFEIFRTTFVILKFIVLLPFKIIKYTFYVVTFPIRVAYAILKPIFIIVGGIFYVAFYLLSLIFFKENEFMNEVMNSITMIYNEKDKIYVPKWKFDVKTMSISLFRERNCEYRTITVINKYCYDHLKYLYQNDQDRIQQLLNDEKLYWYICRKDKAAKRIVDRQH